MGIEIALAVASLAVGVTSAMNQADAAKAAAEAQKAAQKEQKAANASQAAQERRQQIREERIKRARIMQASTNTGTADSSGELGATSNLASQLGGNLGFNSGQLKHASSASDFMQRSADFQTEAANWGAIGGVSRSIFSLTAGSLFNTFNATQPAAPVETRTPTSVGNG